MSIFLCYNYLMTFQDVENARLAYQTKHSEITKKALLIGGAIAIIPAILTASVFGGFGHGTFSIVAVMVSFLLPIGFALVIGLIIVNVLCKNEALAYHRAYKAYFVSQTLTKTFTNLYYNHAQGIDKSALYSTGMVDTGDRFHSNDLTTGDYKGVHFVQADAHIEEEDTDSDGNTTYYTTFKGRFMIYEFPKKFNFRLELIGRGFGGACRVPGANPTTGRKMTKIKTESGDFNQKFRVYGEDGFEAYYILDPAFMVKIEAIADHYDGKVLFGFVNNMLLVGLNNGNDSFEAPSPSQPLDEAKEFNKINSDIKVITDFVDQLALDRKLFS